MADTPPQNPQTSSTTGQLPIPDPTALTTQALEREIGHLRELMESAQRQTSKHLDAADAQADARFKIQIEDIRRQIEAKFQEQDRAVQAALVSADKAVTALETATSRRMESLQELNDSKFITYRTLLDSQADKVGLALAAADKAVDAAFSSSREAIAKAETFNEKRFDLLSKQIDELKTGATLSQGKGAGAATLWGYLVGAAGLVLAVVAWATR